MKCQQFRRKGEKSPFFGEKMSLQCRYGVGNAYLGRNLAPWRERWPLLGSGFFQGTQESPFKGSKVLTDNGKEFTDRFCATGEREPTGNHLFDKVCQKNEIEHRLIKPRKPQTNGMVERFNGRIADILKTIRFNSSEQIASALQNYGRIYNQHIPQRNLGHVAPIQALKQWCGQSPNGLAFAVADLVHQRGIIFSSI